MRHQKSIALLAAISVTLLWASSYIINKHLFQMVEIGPFTLSGYRYFIAAATLFHLMLVFSRKNASHSSCKKLIWKQYFALGFLGFFLAQGMQYVGQVFVTPTQTSLFLCLGNVLMVLLIDGLWLKEVKQFRVYVWIGGVMGSIILYFYPWDMRTSSIVGLLFVLLSSVGYALHLTYSRKLISINGVSPHEIVMKPMFVGALFLIVVGILVEPFPVFSFELFWFLLWLGSINGALAFFLWAWSQKYLKAYESSLINNLVLVEVAALDYLFLAASFSLRQVMALMITSVFILLIQFSKEKKVLP